MGSGSSKVKSGSYIGTGAIKNIPLDFNPSYVEIVSVTEVSKTFANDTMADDTGVQTVYSNGTLAATIAALSADGITLGEGQFSVGVDVNINTVDSEYHYIAHE